MTIFTRPQWCIEPLRPHVDGAVSVARDRRGVHGNQGSGQTGVTVAHPAVLTRLPLAELVS